MSKRSELIALKRSFSADKMISYHHRSGDEEGSGASVLDYYAHAESAEDTFLGEADELARELFSRGFRVYLKKVFTEQEREFLTRLLSGKQSAFQIGQSLGMNYFKFMQRIQKKAYKSVKPLLKLSRKTGWSGATDFTRTIFERLRQLSAGYTLNEIIPRNKQIVEERAKKKAYREAHKEEIRAYREAHREEAKAYREAHREENNASARLRWNAHREENNAAARLRWKAHREEINARRRARYANFGEKAERKAQKKAYKEAHREEIKAYQKEYQTAYRKEEKEAIKAWREAHRKELVSYYAAYRAAHREEINAKKRARRAAKAAEKAGSLEGIGATSDI